MPLLDRRRHHEPAAHGGEDRAAVSAQPTVHVLDASRAVGVVATLLDPEQRATLDAKNRAEQARAARAARAASACKPLLPLAERASANRHADRVARRGPARRRRSSAARALEMSARGARRRTSTGRSSSPRGSCTGSFPQILEHPQYGEAARDLYDERASAARADRRREAADGARRLRLLAGGERRRRHRALSTDAARTARAGALPHAAPAAGQDRGRSRYLSLADFVAPRDERAASTTSARSRSPPGSAPTSWRERFEARARRLQRDHRQGARRSAGRGVRRDAARSARAREWGYGAARR